MVPGTPVSVVAQVDEALAFRYVFNNPLSYVDPTGYKCGTVDELTEDGRVIPRPGPCLYHDYDDLPFPSIPAPNDAGDGGGAGASGGETVSSVEEPQVEQQPKECKRGLSFDFDQFASQIEENRFDLEATLGTLIGKRLDNHILPACPIAREAVVHLKRR